MADIVRTRSTTTSQQFSRRDPGEPKTRTVETVTVRSIRGNRLDVSVLRDLVAALDEAGVPGKALVEACRSDVGHLIQLNVLRVEAPIEEQGAADPDLDPATCSKCGTPVAPCRSCGKPSTCGDAWCAECAPVWPQDGATDIGVVGP